MVNRTALILGCGYVGCALAEYWRAQNWDLICTTTTSSKLAHLEQLAGCAVLLRGDDDDALARLLGTVELLVVSVGARGSSYEEVYLQTAHTVSRVLQNNTHVRQVIYTSSYAVYGDQGGDWVDEETPVRPANGNGDILARTERLILNSATPERRVCVFRLGGIYGPGRDFGRIFGPSAGQVRPGSGEEPGNWIHLDDIVGAIAFATEQRLNGVYNLVSQPIGNGELLNWVCQTYTLAPIRFDPSLPSQRPYHARVSNRKLCEAGYQFRHPQVLPARGAS